MANSFAIKNPLLFPHCWRNKAGSVPGAAHESRIDLQEKIAQRVNKKVGFCRTANLLYKLYKSLQKRDWLKCRARTADTSKFVVRRYEALKCLTICTYCRASDSMRTRSPLATALGSTSEPPMPSAHAPHLRN